MFIHVIFFLFFSLFSFLHIAFWIGRKSFIFSRELACYSKLNAYWPLSLRLLIWEFAMWASLMFDFDPYSVLIQEILRGSFFDTDYTSEEFFQSLLLSLLFTCFLSCSTSDVQYLACCLWYFLAVIYFRLVLKLFFGMMPLLRLHAPHVTSDNPVIFLRPIQFHL